MKNGKIAYFLKNLDAFIAGSSLVAVVFLTAHSVFMRYVVNRPITWLEEVQLILFVWIAFFGSSVAFRANSHIVIEILVDMFPVRLQRIIEVVNSLIVAAVLAFIMYLEVLRGLSLTRSGRATSILEIPLSLNYFAVAAALLFMLVNFAVERYGLFASWKRGGADKKGDQA